MTVMRARAGLSLLFCTLLFICGVVRFAHAHHAHPEVGFSAAAHTEGCRLCDLGSCLAKILLSHAENTEAFEQCFCQAAAPVERVFSLSPVYYAVSSRGPPWLN